MELLKNTLLYLVLLCFLTTFESCKKDDKEIDEQPETMSKEELGLSLNEKFWESLHNARYERIDALIEEHQEYADKYPNDITHYDQSGTSINSHLGYLNIWRVAEILNDLPEDYATNTIALSGGLQTIQKHTEGAISFFDKSLQLDPLPQTVGFLASSQIAKIGYLDPATQQEEITALREEARKNSEKAITGWPAFNLFTIHYNYSNYDVESDFFQNAVEGFWRNLELCSDVSLQDRENADIDLVVDRIEALSDPLTKRACGNTWIAPYNSQGFGIIFADMLVKNGDIELAQRTYEAVKGFSDFDTWPYKDLIDQRIQNINENVEKFNKTDIFGRSPMIITQKISCMVCHQKTGAPVSKFVNN